MQVPRLALQCIFAFKFCIFECSVPVSAVAQNTEVGLKPPLWPPHFSAKVVQVTTVPGLKNWTFPGEFYYDFQAGGNLWVSGVGQMEPQCIEVYPSSEGKACHTLATTWNGFHVLVPEDKRCCHWGRDALNTPIRPDWLALSNATFVGLKTVNRVRCEGWRADGFNKNLYYSTADDRRLPCQLYMGDIVTPAGVQKTFGMETTFDIESIVVEPIGHKMFSLPSWCDAKHECNYAWGPTALPTQSTIVV